MKPLYAFIFACLFFSCCKPTPKPAFTAFDFSYDAVFSESFSIKFTQGDTVFVNQRFTRSGDLKRNATYYSLLNGQDRNEVDSFVNSIDFSKFKDRYDEPYMQDGTEYQFYIEKDTMRRTIYGLGDSVPPQLSSFANWLASLKSKLKLTPIDTTIDFGSSKHFILPEVVLPTIKFLPPRKKKS